MQQHDEYLTTTELAQRLFKGKVSARTLEGLRVRGESLPYVKVGSRVLYPLSRCEAALQSQARTSTSEVKPAARAGRKAG